MTVQDVDMVNHPPHYQSPSGAECIDVIRPLPHSLATAIKYVWRHREKWNLVEDLNKAKFYLNDYETHLFKSKDADHLYHRGTVDGSKHIMNTRIRTDLRKHIVYLEENNLAEAAFFKALYLYISKSQYGLVRYKNFQAVHEALDNLIIAQNRSMSN